MTDQRLGARIRYVRIRRGWRQIDLARRAGVSQSMVSRIERGHLDGVTVEAIRAVAAALDIRIDLVSRYRGGELDRLLAAGHSALHESVARVLAGSPAGGSHRRCRSRSGGIAASSTSSPGTSAAAPCSSRDRAQDRVRRHERARRDARSQATTRGRDRPGARLARRRAVRVDLGDRGRQQHEPAASSRPRDDAPNGLPARRPLDARGGCGARTDPSAASVSGRTVTRGLISRVSGLPGPPGIGSDCPPSTNRLVLGRGERVRRPYRRRTSPPGTIEAGSQPGAGQVRRAAGSRRGARRPPQASSAWPRR